MTTKEKAKPHNGLNIMIARKRRGWKQHVLAEQLNELLDTNYQQSDISKLESQEVIDEDMLEKVAAVIECSPEFLKNFSVDDLISSYSIINNAEVNITGGEASGSEIMQNKDEDIDIEHQTINNIDISKFNELHELRRQDALHIGRLESEVENLKKELKQSKGK